MFARIAVVNRGEAAMRLIHAVRDLNAEGGAQIEVVALYTDVERRAKFVREADRAYPLGPAAARPYLDLARLEQALRATEADAVWVGWGFVAEDPAFAQLCERIGVAFIGPSADAMRKLGDKIGAKLLAEQVGVPVAPWSRGPVDTLDDAIEAAVRIGYPLMLKATAGGGGRGIRVVTDENDLAEAYSRTRDEAERAFGSGVVFLERLLTGARHVEVQIIADGQGAAWALGVRDCSIQRRNQKIIEESSSPVLTDEQAADLAASAERLALAVGYRGAATVEFLYQPDERRFAFLEVNTRLQVEHPVTELTTDVDLVKAQIRVAAGQRLTGPRPVEAGHAVEARLNAEDPDRDFAPAPGRIALLDLPAGPGIRVDTGVDQGDLIPADFDSMIAKVIAYGRDRDEALARLRRAVLETTVVIDGGATNKSLVLDLLDQPEVIDGTADTGWIDRERANGRLESTAHAGVALVAAAIEDYEAEEEIEVARLLQTSRGGRPHAQHKAGRAVDLELRGTNYRVAVAQTGPRVFRVAVGPDDSELVVDAEMERLGEYTSRLTIGDRAYRLVTAAHGPTQLVEVEGVTHRISHDEGGVLRSPAPALVVSTPVSVGSTVEAGTPVLVLESMKMETVVHAPFTAAVRELLVSVGSQVETGAPLVRLADVETGAQPSAAPAARSAADLALPGADCATSVDEQARRGLASLHSMLLGFDIDPRDESAPLTAYLQARAELEAADRVPMAEEIALLDVFADFAELGRNRPAGEEKAVESQVHSPREYFHTYLQSLDVDRAGLPEDFRDKLARVLHHYGLADFDRGPELEEAVFRIFLAQQRSAPEVAMATSLLQHWSTQPCPEEELAEAAYEVLDRLVLAAQRRFPVVGDLARSVRFRWFDQPLVDAERAIVLAGVRAEVTALAAEPDAPDRDERIDALASIPEQLVRFLLERIDEGPARDEPLLEVLAKRHYRDHDLRGPWRVADASRPMVAADYVLDARPTRLVSTVGTVEELRSGSGLTEAVAAQMRTSAEQATVIDLYLSWPHAPATPAQMSADLRARLAALPFAEQARRVAIAVGVGTDRPVASFTFRPEGGDIVEDDLVRGVHPMVGRRLNLWRLRDFDLTRLDAPDDVLLYRCVARDNPADERLVAMAQIRQLAVIRDDDGQIISVPHAERAVANCMEAIRRARASLGTGRGRLDMNHVWLHIWPVVDADLTQLDALQQKIAPLTVGAGVEEVLVQASVGSPNGGLRPVAIRFYYQPGSGVVGSVERPPTERLKPVDDYTQKVLRARRRGTVYPYEAVGLIAGTGGTFVEHDLDDTGALVPVNRAPGSNKAAVVVGVVHTPSPTYPDGITRVLIAGDPTRSLGAVSEGECSRIIAAIDLADRMQVPVEWFAVSAGARVSMESGTENMDWVARALRRIVTFTQAGGEINVVVTGINVGAQPYWNAEATMLMHTKGILVMTPDSAMVLTGKQSLDFSGGVSAEDNFGIGGYDRVMGPNGQAQYWAHDLAEACATLLRHYEYTYVVPGERGPRHADTTDPADRDITAYPHSLPGSDFRTIGDIFSAETNPERKRPFDIRTLIHALLDQDHDTLERWAGMADADTAVVVDGRLGGWPVCVLGIESKPVPRRGFPPADGPDTYTAGTLFPRSSKKAARAINAASGNRPLVVLANLSGFDGSPDSMRHLQLEYGAEIGRAVVNFDGPIVFCVVSRYHGGAFVVFSKALNPSMTVLALEGSYASVLGGAPAAAVVFAAEVNARTAADPRVRAREAALEAAGEPRRADLALDLAEVQAAVRAEKLGEVAAEFDGVHSIERAVAVGSVDAVISAAQMRPRIIGAIQAGLARSGRTGGAD